MGKLKAIAAGAKALAVSGASVIKAHSPVIMVVGGIVCGIAATVTACKATTKVSDIIDNAKEELGKVDCALEHPETVKEGQTYTEEDAKRDRKIIKTQTGVKLIKNYAIPAILGISSIALILGGYKILHGRNVAITSAFNATTAAFAKYRERVIAEQGEVMDRHFRYGTKIKKNVTTDPETGKETVSYEEVSSDDIAETIGSSSLKDTHVNKNLTWDFCADTSPEFRTTFDRRPENLDNLKELQRWAEGELKRRGWLLAWEVAYQANVPLNKDCFGWGWMMPKTPEEKKNWPELSIGIYEFINHLKRDEGVSGYDVEHRDSYPIVMNAWEITDDPIFYERYRPFASLVKPGQKFKYGKVPSFKFDVYPYNSLHNIAYKGA